MRAALIVLLALASASALASPSQDLDRARQSWRAKDWDSAIPLLTYLLYPGPNAPPKLADKYDLGDAHVLLGVCHYETGHSDEAKVEFEAALAITPDRTLDPLLFSTGARRLFDDTRADIDARAKRDAERARLATAAADLEAYKKSLRVYEAVPYYVNFVPFGAGQFQEKRVGRAAFFTISQGLTGATSAGIFLYLAGTYGLVAKVPLTDGPRVRTLQQVEIGTGIAFIGLYAWGVYDSLRHYKARQQIQGDDSLLPKELRTPAKPVKKTSLLDRLQVSPIVTPSGVGIGIGLEN